MRTIKAADTGEFLARIIVARNQKHVLQPDDDPMSRELGFIDTDAQVRVRVPLPRVKCRASWFADTNKTCGCPRTARHQSDEVLAALGMSQWPRLQTPEDRERLYAVVPVGTVPERWEA